LSQLRLYSVSIFGRCKHRQSNIMGETCRYFCWSQFTVILNLEFVKMATVIFSLQPDIWNYQICVQQCKWEYLLKLDCGALASQVQLAVAVCAFFRYCRATQMADRSRNRWLWKSGELNWSKNNTRCYICWNIDCELRAKIWWFFSS